MSFLYSLYTNSGSFKLWSFLQWHWLTAKTEWDAAAGCFQWSWAQEKSSCYLKRGKFTNCFFSPSSLPFLSSLLREAKLSESRASRLSLGNPDMHSQLLGQPLEKQGVLLTLIALFPTPVPLTKSLSPKLLLRIGFSDFSSNWERFSPKQWFYFQ